MGADLVKQRGVILLLTLLSFFCLCSCKSKELTLIGTWRAQCDMTELAEAHLSVFADIPSDARLLVPVTVTFAEDGSFRAEIEAASARKAVSVYVKARISSVAAAMYAGAEQDGIRHSAFDAAFQEQYHCTVEQYLREQMQDEALSRRICEAVSAEGVFEDDGVSLCLNGTDRLSYTLDGSDLTITACDGTVFTQLTLPLIFTKA